jgi:hypothetical protein
MPPRSSSQYIHNVRSANNGTTTSESSFTLRSWLPCISESRWLDIVGAVAGSGARLKLERKILFEHLRTVGTDHPRHITFPMVVGQTGKVTKQFLSLPTLPSSTGWAAALAFLPCLDITHKSNCGISEQDKFNDYLPPLRLHRGFNTVEAQIVDHLLRLPPTIFLNYTDPRSVKAGSILNKSRVGLFLPTVEYKHPSRAGNDDSSQPRITSKVYDPHKAQCLSYTRTNSSNSATLVGEDPEFEDELVTKRKRDIIDAYVTDSHILPSFYELRAHDSCFTPLALPSAQYKRPTSASVILGGEGTHVVDQREPPPLRKLERLAPSVNKCTVKECTVSRCLSTNSIVANTT